MASTLNSVIGALRASLTLDSAKFQDGAKKAQVSAGKLQGSFKQMLPAIQNAAKGVAVAAGAAAAAIATGAVMSANAAKEIQRSSQALGMTAQSYQTLTIASQKFGIEGDKMKDVLKDLNDRIGDYLQTGAGPLKDFMDNVAKPQGVNIDDLIKLPPEDQLIKIQSLMESANLSLQEQVFHMEALAGDASYLIPMLSKGGAELDKIRNNLIATGQVLSDDVIGNLSNFSSNLSKIGDTMSGWKNLFYSAMAPQLDDLSTKLATFLMNSQGIRDAFTTAGQSVGSFMTYTSGLLSQITSIKAETSQLASIFTSLGTLASAAWDQIVFRVKVFYEVGKMVWDVLTAVTTQFRAIADVALYAFAAIIPQSNALGDTVENGILGALRRVGAYVSVLSDEFSHNFQLIGAYGKGAVDAIRDSFSLLPGALGDLMMQGTNMVLGAVETMINGVISRINGAVTAIKGAMAQVAYWTPERLGGDGGKSLGMMNGPQLPTVSPIEINRAKNEWEGAAAELGTSIKGSLNRHVKPVLDAQARNAVANATGNIGFGFAESGQSTTPVVTPVSTGPILSPPSTGSGGSGGGKGGAGGGSEKLSQEAKDAVREAERQTDAYKSLQDELTKLQGGLGKTALEQRILNEQVKVGTAASPEAVAAIVSQMDAIERWSDSMDAAKQTFSGGFAGIITGAKSARDVLTSVLDDIAQKLARNAADGFFQKFIQPAVMSFVGGPKVQVVGDDALSNSIRGIPGFANGTTNFAGGLAMVGERGRELVNLPRGSSVTNAQDTKRMMNGGGQAASIHISVDEGVKVQLLNDAAKQSAQITQAGISSYRKNGFNADVRKYQSDPKRV